MTKTSLTILALALLAIAPGDIRVENIDFVTLENDKVKLTDYLAEGPVLLDFWATWCKPCVKAFPKLNKLHQKYNELGFTVLGINEDGPRSRSKIKPFVNSLGVKFPVLLDPNNDVMRRLQVAALPTSMLISQQGDIIRTFVGFQPAEYAELEKQILVLLDNQEKEESK